MDRAEIVHENFCRRVRERDFPASRAGGLEEAGLTAVALVRLFEAQAMSRQLDRMSRVLQSRGQGFYTIGSSGHEGGAAIAAALRPTDPAFLHYRDAAFQISRSQQVPGQTPLWDMLLSFTVSADDPISGGRHKVLGSRSLNIPPQTSTIASHLPKAMGAAFSVALGKTLAVDGRVYPDDAIVMCSFGDASLNHSTAQGAINASGWAAFKGSPLPVLFVCEDNGIGISVKTPQGWIEASMAHRPGVRYFRCNGLDVVDTYATAVKAASYVRKRRAPAFLHMTCVRLYGHAGPDAQQVYLSREEIEAAEADDPLLHTAGRLVSENVLSAEHVLNIYQDIERRIARIADDAVLRPKLRTSADVSRSIIPPKRDAGPGRRLDDAERDALFGPSEVRLTDQPQHLAKLVNWALTDLMSEYGEIVLAGQDIGRKGGVYGVTQKLQARFGAHRVIDTLLDEQSILGLSIGLAHNGMIPIPEIQFLAYLHNAEDQIRGEAATLPFFSNGQYANPMILRIAGLGYQRGFGGHFHNDNSIAVLRDIPGVIIACPSNGLDAVLMLREAVRLARQEQRVVVFLEPIALYMTKDLHSDGDKEWSFLYPARDAEGIRLGDIGRFGDGEDVAIVTYGNGYYLSRQAARVLEEAHGVRARVIDMRWLAPLPADQILRATAPCKSVLIVDECRITGSQSEALMALFAERAGDKALQRIAADDCFIATGPAYGATLPSRDGIVRAAAELVQVNPRKAIAR